MERNEGSDKKSDSMEATRRSPMFFPRDSRITIIPGYLFAEMILGFGKNYNDPNELSSNTFIQSPCKYFHRFGR